MDIFELAATLGDELKKDEKLVALEAARKKGIAVTSEMEVFFDLCPATVFAITGSDGKTTTTTLIAKMLEAEGKKVFVGGNIGKPLLPEIEKPEKADEKKEEAVAQPEKPKRTRKKKTETQEN